MINKMRILALSALSLALLACNGKTPAEGVWVIQITPGDEVPDTVTCTENFTAGDCPSDTTPVASPWTSTSEIDFSASGTVVKVAGGPDNEAFLFIGDRIYPGTFDSGTYTFSWDAFNDISNTETHTSGFQFMSDVLSKTTTTMTLTMEGRRASGTFTTRTESSREYSEDDVFSNEVFSMAPFGSEVFDSTGFGVNNDGTTAQCSDARCMVKVVEVSVSQGNVSGTLIDDSATEDYDAIEDSGWGPGNTGGAPVF